MSTMTITLIIIGALILLALYLYNNLITAKARIEEAWSGIDVQLKRRSNLIPNLVETVKGYAEHEKEVFQRVTEARSALMKAGGAREAEEADRALTSALKSLFAVAEAYPELRASENFKELQEELSDTEDKIAYSRQFYNTSVLDYNVRIRSFPGILLAQVLNFGPAEFFEAEEGEREAPEVKF